MLQQLSRPATTILGTATYPDSGQGCL